MSNKIFIDIEKLIKATPVDEESDAPVSEKYGKFAWVWSPVLNTYVAYCIHRKDYSYQLKLNQIVLSGQPDYSDYFKAVQPYTFGSLDSISVGDKLPKEILANVKLVPFILHDDGGQTLFFTKARGSTEIESNDLEDFRSSELDSSTYVYDLGMFVSDEPTVENGVISFKGKDIFFDKEYILELPEILDSFPVEEINAHVPSGCKLKFFEQVNAYLPCDSQNRVVVSKVEKRYSYEKTVLHSKCVIRINCKQLFMTAATFSLSTGFSNIPSSYAILFELHPEIATVLESNL